MPSSAIETVPYIIEYLRKYRPNLSSLLDIGIGFGKFGYLLRDYYDSKKDFHFQPEEWKLQLTGVDIFPGYISNIQRQIYTTIIIDDIFHALPTIKKHEVALISDVIEHFPKDKGLDLLHKLFDVVDDIVISTPLGFHPKKSKSVLINPYENHISGWYPEDFNDFKIKELEIVRRITKPELVMVTYLTKN